MASGVATKVTLKPILGFMDMKDPQLAELAIETTIILDPNLLIKDLCKSIMDRYDLGHVADNFQVYVRHLDSEYYPWKTYFGDMNAPIGSMAFLFNEILAIKILLPTNFFIACGKMMKTNGVYERIIKHLISRISDNNGQMSNPTIQVAKNEFEGHSSRGLPSDNLFNMDETARARHWNNTSMSGRFLQVPERDLTRNFASGPQQNTASLDHLESDAFKDHIEALDSIIRDFSTKTPSHN
uniref:CNOT1_CAF1_bind domain-containing protein n=1 Tax=Strongyloides venezuelensis TaxID=75913 RepID=A0A0K0F389_STRVS